MSDEDPEEPVDPVEDPETATDVAVIEQEVQIDSSTSFEWSDSKIPEVDKLTKEIECDDSDFSVPITGPTNLGTRNGITPGRVFRTFLDLPLLKDIARESTKYSKSRCERSTRKNKPTPLEYTPEDILRFILCIFSMGIISLPDVKMYYRGDTSQPLIKRCIPSYHLFQRMSVEVHVVDTSTYSAVEQVMKNRENCFWKVGGLLEGLSQTFKRCRIPRRDVSVDEFCVPFKGRHRARVYNPSKPNKYHLKGYSLNESQTGYCLGMFMYQGKDSSMPVDVTATEYPVVRLVQEYPQIHNRVYVMGR